MNFSRQSSGYSMVSNDSPSTSSDRHSELLTLRAETDQPFEDKKKYRGRYTVWPGVFLIVALLITSAVLITIFAIHTNDEMVLRRNKIFGDDRTGREIQGGGDDDLEIDVEDDGQVGNPKEYETSMCAHPNYVSKNGRIFAEHNGKSEPISIKGINWFGMETSHAIPFGLWDNPFNGTTAYEIATFLAKNKFNSVRLPLCVENLVKNVVPDKRMINLNSNRALDASSYIGMIKSIVQALGYRKISVLLDIHTLTPTETGDLWYSAEVPKTTVLSAVEILTKNLCSSKYWNIVGLDLKNEPWKCTWGDGNEDTDFVIGAEAIGNKMLEGCDKWLAFVEGVNDNHEVTIDGETFNYYDWWGGGLQKAGQFKPNFSAQQKIVWSPHYYSPSVYPNQYMFASGTPGATLQNFVELSTSVLKSRIIGTMEHMFGYLAKEPDQYAIVLGEFGGIYAGDMHPEKTNQRSIDLTINQIKQEGYAGGYLWSLNPESGYEYNPADTLGFFQEGLLDMQWLRVNEAYLNAIGALDDMQDLVPFPCFSE